MNKAQHLLAERLARGAGVQEGSQRRHGPAGDAPRGDAQGIEGLREQGHDLHLGTRVRITEELDAHLGELARLAPQCGPLAHDGRLVAQAHGQVGVREAGRHHARDGKREVGTQDQQAAVGIEQLERGVLHATTLLEGAAVLDERRLDGQVAMSRKACARLRADALAGERLGRQDVTKAPWRPYGQARPPSLAPRLLEASEHRRFSTPQ